MGQAAGLAVMLMGEQEVGLVVGMATGWQDSPLAGIAVGHVPGSEAEKVDG